MKKNDCEKHAWRMEHNPPELYSIPGLDCPLCSLEADVASAIRNAKSSGDPEDWQRAELKNGIYLSGVDRHREKLSPAEIKSLDRATTARFLLSF